MRDKGAVKFNCIHIVGYSRRCHWLRDSRKLRLETNGLLCQSNTVLNNSLQRVLTSPVVDYICKNSFKVNSARLPRETGHSNAFVLLYLSHCSNHDHCSCSVQVFTFQRLFTAPVKEKGKEEKISPEFDDNHKE